MSFNAQLRRALDKQQPTGVRFIAFLQCIERYCWASKQSFHGLYERLGKQVGFSWTERPSPNQLERAALMLRDERKVFLERLRRYEEQRRKEKSAGRRHARRSDLKGLYGDAWHTA